MFKVKVWPSTPPSGEYLRLVTLKFGQLVALDVPQRPWKFQDRLSSRFQDIRVERFCPMARYRIFAPINSRESICCCFQLKGGVGPTTLRSSLILLHTLRGRSRGSRVAVCRPPPPSMASSLHAAMMETEDATRFFISWLVTNWVPARRLVCIWSQRGIHTLSVAGSLKLVVMHLHRATQLRRSFEHITKHPAIMLLVAASLVQ